MARHEKEENGEIMSPAHKGKHHLSKSKRHHGGLMPKKAHHAKMSEHHKGAKKY